MDWWLIIRINGQAHAWQVGSSDDDDRLQEIIMRARVQLGVPAGDIWVDSSGVDLQLTVGEPHPSLQAVVHRLAELDAVDPAALATYRTESNQARRQVRMDSVRAALAGLPVDERRIVAAEHAGAADPRPNPRSVGSEPEK